MGNNEKNIDVLKNMKKGFTKALFQTQISSKNELEKIKGYLAKNRSPPAAMLVSWQSLSKTESFLEGMIASIDSQITQAKINEHIREGVGAKGTKDTERALNKLQAEFGHVQSVFSDLMKLQTNVVENLSEMSTNIAEDVQSQTQYSDKILSQIQSDISAELFTKMKQEDPDVFNQVDQGVISSLEQEINNLKKEGMNTNV